MCHGVSFFSVLPLCTTGTVSNNTPQVEINDIKRKTILKAQKQGEPFLDMRRIVVRPQSFAYKT